MRLTGVAWNDGQSLTLRIEDRHGHVLARQRLPHGRVELRVGPIATAGAHPVHAHARCYPEAIRCDQIRSSTVLRSRSGAGPTAGFRAEARLTERPTMRSQADDRTPVGRESDDYATTGWAMTLIETTGSRRATPRRLGGLLTPATGVFIGTRLVIWAVAALAFEWLPASRRRPWNLALGARRWELLPDDRGARIRGRPAASSCVLPPLSGTRRRPRACDRRLRACRTTHLARLRRRGVRVALAASATENRRDRRDAGGALPRHLPDDGIPQCRLYGVALPRARHRGLLPR